MERGGEDKSTNDIYTMLKKKEREMVLHHEAPILVLHGRRGHVNIYFENLCLDVSFAFVANKVN